MVSYWHYGESNKTDLWDNLSPNIPFPLYLTSSSICKCCYDLYPPPLMKNIYGQIMPHKTKKNIDHSLCHSVKFLYGQDTIVFILGFLIFDYWSFEIFFKYYYIYCL
jgi:hypothetical protein